MGALVIWKFTLNLSGVVMMPAHRKILSAHTQGDDICIWAEVDPATPLRPKRFHIVPTGSEVPGLAYFVGTVLMEGGALVFHVYEAAP